MDGHNLTNEQILAFSTALFQAERSQAAVEKYLRSARAFSLFLDGRPVTKDITTVLKNSVGQQLVFNHSSTFPLHFSLENKKPPRSSLLLRSRMALFP